MSTIGVFDSGCGGLSVLKEIFRLLPDEKYIFYADNAWCPYGEKPQEVIIERCSFITQYLLDKGADIIVVACNTATGQAISTLRNEFPVKFIGMEPAVKPAALATRSGVIGVLATEGTLKGSKYLINKGKYEGDVKIVEHVGKGWVELVENGILTGPEAENIVRRSLCPLLEQGADNIVLGCTHYPFLIDTIREVAGPDVKIIDPAPAAARHLVYVMAQEGLIDDKDSAKVLSRVIELKEREDRGEKEDSGFAKQPDISLVTSGDPAPLKRIFDMTFSKNQS